MKKILITLVIFTIWFSSVNAYNYSAKDEAIISKVTKTLREYIKQWRLDRDKITNQLEKITERKRWTRIAYLVGWILAEFDVLTTNELKTIITWPSFDINDHTNDVFAIKCVTNDSRVSIWSSFTIEFDTWRKWLFTNKHVVENSIACYVANHTWEFLFRLDLDNSYTYNTKTDFALFYLTEEEEKIITESWANYLKDVQTCSSLDVWNPVWVVWYPAYATDETWETIQNNRITTKWIISWYRNERITGTDDFRFNFSNFYVSNRIDGWNSWWLALAETNSWFCVLWIPTWLSRWNFENQWVILNISNIIDTTLK